ncbi:MAG: hypothetical protein CMF62_05745 [Magnetococcales bacterium]|nr:hypothetical protein [Magnetococcales bacterium]
MSFANIIPKDSKLKLVAVTLLFIWLSFIAAWAFQYSVVWFLKANQVESYSDAVERIASSLPTSEVGFATDFFYSVSVVFENLPELWFFAVLFGCLVALGVGAMLFTATVFRAAYLSRMKADADGALREAQNRWRKSDMQKQDIRQQLNAMHERISDCFILIRNGDEILHANSKARRFFESVFEYEQDLKGAQLSMIIPGLDDTPLGAALMQAMKKATASKVEAELKKNVWVQVSIFPTSVGAYVYFTDISRQKSAKIRVGASIRLLRQILDSAPQALAITDNNWSYLAANRQWVNQFKLTGQKILGRYHGQVLPDSLPNLQEVAQQVQQHDVYRSPESVYKVGNTDEYISWEVRPWWDDDDNHSGYIILANFMTEARRNRQKAEMQRQQERKMAYHDALTGLPNRQLFYDRLNQALAQAYKTSDKVGLMFLDLDGFKPINDTYGHDAGDILLKEVAQRLQDCVRNTDTVSRLGGDEFTIVLSSIKDVNDVQTVAQKVIDSINQPFQIGDADVKAGTSIGISTYPQNGSTAVELIKASDTAMYQAKKTGKNRFCVFEKESNTAIFPEGADMGKIIRDAVADGELELHFQPQVEGLSGKVIGIDALVRWRHPKQGIIEPMDFLPVAEETGSIIEVGNWVVREACRQAMEWRKEGLGDFPVHVNISSRQFQDSDFVDTIKAALEESSLPPSALGLEMTEMLLLEYPKTTLETLNELKMLGVQLTVDDFGLNKTPLNALKDFPVDAIKIHQNFVRNLVENEQNQAVVKTIIDLAENLELMLIGEGVETEAQAKFLLAQGCKYIQWFWYGRPVKPSATADFLRLQTPKPNK